jgi:hypothetical protein
MREHGVANRFREAGAVSAAEALTLEDLKMKEGGAFEALLENQAILETDDGRFYLDKARATEVLKGRRKRSLVILCLLVALWSVYMILTPLLFQP